VLRYKAEGYKAIRAQSGVPGLEKVYGVGRGTMFYEPADADLPSEHDWSTPKYLNHTPKLFEAVRNAVGPDIHLLHDVHHRLTPIEAGRLGKSLEPFNLFWMEDATPAEDQAAFKLIRQHTTTPLAVGEIFNSIWDCKALIENQLIDYIRATVVHAGGITHLRRIADLASPRRDRPEPGVHGRGAAFRPVGAELRHPGIHAPHRRDRRGVPARLHVQRRHVVPRRRGRPRCHDRRGAGREVPVPARLPAGEPAAARRHALELVSVMERLHPSRLAALPADVARPRYERAALQAGIVHIGVGAFQRAHLAVVNEAALHASGDLRWGTVGVSLRQADTRDALSPQAGLYTLAIRDAAPDGTARETLQVVGHLLDVLVAPENPRAVLERIAHAHTRIVSLTVTEKGYHHHPASCALRLDDADIVHDLANPAAPRTAIGFIVHALQLRRQRALPSLTLLSCDNLPANGDTLRSLVLAFAEQADPTLRDWITENCSFPNSMVDRIVPRTTDADREHVSARLGLQDAWPVIGEPFLEWVVEDRFVNGRPAWNEGGARFVDHAEPFERLKLRLVNGSHSALAYLGAMAGWRTVDRAIANPALRAYLDALLRDEIAPTLPALHGLDLGDYRTRLLQRFANPALQHQTAQIAMDGSQKLPQRLLGTVRDRLAANAPIDGLALAVAAWVHYLSGSDETGAAHTIHDPLASALAAQRAKLQAAASVNGGVAAFTSLTSVFGDLGAEPRFVDAVARQLRSLQTRGVHASLQDWR
jgi:fructuronate reductase